MLDEIPYVIKEWMKKGGILEQFINNRDYNPVKLYDYIDFSFTCGETEDGYAFWGKKNTELNRYLKTILTYDVLNNNHFRPAREDMKNVKVEVLSIGYENGIGITTHTSGSIVSIIIPICIDNNTPITSVFLGRGKHTGRRASPLNYSLKGKEVKMHPVYDEVFSKKSLQTLLGITDEA